MNGPLYANVQLFAGGMEIGGHRFYMTHKYTTGRVVMYTSKQNNISLLVIVYKYQETFELISSSFKIID